MTGKNINRRRFLKKAAGITAGAAAFPYIVPASVLGKAGKVAPSNRIVMGCIGMGGQGIFDMKQFLQYDDAQVVAVCDVNKESTSKNRLVHIKDVLPTPTFASY
ncbi:MAG: twin-arginine translocation signal domain-containing protein [Planctomycetota bacterium]|jgi:hypothetical protein